MKKIIAAVALTFCCAAAIAQSNPIVVVGPDGRISQCIVSGGIIKCY